jgi:predicted MFS family arabinose efflux permease
MITNEVGEEKPETSDVAGAATVTGGLLVLVYAIVKAETYGWGSGKTIGLFLAAVALLVAFVVIELRSRAPLIRLDIFRVRSLSASNTAMLLVASGLFAMFFFASLYVQQLRGYSPIKAGLAFLPFTLGIVIGASLAQQFIKRVGVRAVSLSGLAIATVGMLLYTQLSLTGSYFGELFPAVMVTSIGMGLTFVPVTLLATTNIPSEDAGLASGLFNTSQQIGGALGLAILSTLAATRTSHKEAALGHDAALVSGYHLAFLIGAVAMGVAIVLLGTLIRRSDVRQIQEADEPLPVAA